MSLFLSRLRLGVRRSSVSLLLSNGFSTSLRQTPPCSIICATSCGHDLATLTVHYANQRSWTHLDKRVPMNLVYPHIHNEDKTQTIGASYGWIATLNDDAILRLQDDFNPVASDIDPIRIQLPPLVTLPHCQTKIITNVSMSSTSPEDDGDCVVAVKFLGPQLSFCKPAGKSKPEWTNIKIENPCFYSSRVMFSKKDNMFRILGAGGHCIGSWDVCSKSEHFVESQSTSETFLVKWYKKTKCGIAKIKRKALMVFKLDDEGHSVYTGDDPKLQIQSVRFTNIPKLTNAEQELLDSCSKSEHLVESPTGETFLVKQYKKTAKIVEGVAKMKTEALMVFKIDDECNAVYTQDIGDVTMFLSKSEPFCVPSNSFTGLPRNYVDIFDVDEMALVDVADNPFSSSGVNGTFTTPYHIPPQDIHN